jgi:hypothetical protein
LLDLVAGVGARRSTRARVRWFSAAK